ncbi:transposase [Arcanobacterium phocisimile]|uniref:Transposase n=1 Tax=Arcanobacterium phocisimile TaxID=1302235 RepID=A0ABX7IK12_9ACTO|nr:transposase [Arcanobacterium phocisimile]
MHKKLSPKNASDPGIDESTGSVGGSYDNTLAETVNGLRKSELIYSQTSEGLTEVEWETLGAVHRSNTTRLHCELGYPIPQEIENDRSNSPLRPRIAICKHCLQ